MRGATPGIPAFTILSIPIRFRKSRRLSEVSNWSDTEVTADPSAVVVIQDSEDNTEGVSLPNQEETSGIKDGFHRIPSATNAADDASARRSVSDELNEPKDLGDASRSKGKGKVDPVDKKAEKKRIAAKAKADLKAGRIPTFRIGGTYEVLPSEAPVAQSLGVIRSFHVNSDSAAIPPCPAVNVSQIPPPRAPSLTSLPRLASKLSSDVFPCFLQVINTGNRIVTAYEAEVQEREDRIKTLASRSNVEAAWQEVGHLRPEGGETELEDEVKKRDVQLEAASIEIAGLRANLENSPFTEDRLRKERDEARRRADEIASGSSVRGAIHSSRLERIRSYLVDLHAPEEYVKEEEEYLAKVESFDPLGDDTLFPTPPPPPAGLPRDAASQVLDGISELGSFLSPPQDNQDGDQV
ncbi:hypothetical protein AALP_AA2G114800 [Arabis alpina]|uniref:Uncharacterized protein n=1 Tax=Arabis alpina TaxID=50452 RepID=A0A087HGR9_ARAAL|nr:hypothetical protein AALP_AA2G114800 [Arabis alpina]